MFYENIILLPTVINIKADSIKLQKLKIFLWLFSRLIPRSVLENPRQTNIRGKYLFGFKLLAIMLSENIYNDTANNILT